MSAGIGRITARVFAALASCGVSVGLFLACQPTQVLCTADNTGHGGQTVLARRDLPGLTAKNDCHPRVEVIRSDADLRSAYEAVGIHIVDPDGGAPLPGAIALPAVDFSRESVILREAADPGAIEWVVASGGALTFGTQACAGAAGATCIFQTFAVESVVTSAETYTCDALGCGGGR